MKAWNWKKSALLGVLILCVAVLCLLGIREAWLDEMQQAALAELEDRAGEYDPQSIVLSGTNAGRARELANALGAELRITENGRFATLTLPEGTVAVNIPMWGDDPDHEIYILNREHDYKGTACTICGGSYPEATDYSGKVISIMGDSVSAFEGYIPTADGTNLEHKSFYPRHDITSVDATWWMQTITELDAKLGVNESWAGSRVINTIDGNSGNLGEDAAMASLTRIRNLGANGTPDVILFYGCGNDIGEAVTLGTFDPSTAPTEADLTATKWDSLADAYVAAILRMRYYYPDAEIISILPGPTAYYYTDAERQEYCAVIAAICAHYGVACVDINTCGITVEDLPDGTHPDAKGMDYITDAVLDVLLNGHDVDAGENVVNSVTPESTNAGADRPYYKGVSKGKAFVEHISGEEVTVTVMMGGWGHHRFCLYQWFDLYRKCYG